MPEKETVTEQFNELLQLNSTDLFIESLTELLEIKTIIVRIPESVSADEINSPGNKLPVSELIFKIALDEFFNYGEQLLLRAKSLIDEEINDMEKLIDQNKFLAQLERKLRIVIGKFNWSNPISFLSNVGFTPINNRNDELVEYKSSLELDFSETHYRQIENEIHYRLNLMHPIYDYVRVKLNDFEYDEKKKGAFNWYSEGNIPLELSEIGFAITCMPQFNSLGVNGENDFVRKFLSLFGVSGNRVAQHRHMLEIRNGESQFAQYFNEAFRTRQKIDKLSNTKKK
ncbi:MAG: hypothetical protein JST70_05430 [Bacteroidetes bacterium]|nr:hypothetical protein [Bacteroidota bacterium]